MTEEKKQKISKDDCDKNMDMIMLKVQNAMLKTVADITKKFEDSLSSAGKTFAKKSEFDELKKTVKEMNKIHEARQYDWLKYAVTTAVGIILSTLFIK